MSGHSKWSTIKHKKEATDAKRGKLFSKLSRAILIAIKIGGANPETNYKLRIAIDAAMGANMPKSSIDRALSKAVTAKSLEEVTYEGFGPENISLIVEVATDNKNRSSQDIKSLFDKGGGHMVGPNSVAFNFDQKGQIVIGDIKDLEESTLKLIDMGVEEIEEAGGELEIFVAPNELMKVKKDLEDDGFRVVSAKLVQKPKSLQRVSAKDAEKVIKFLDRLDEHEDVVGVFTNADIELK